MKAQTGGLAAIAILKAQGLYAERVLDVSINLEREKIASITVVYSLDVSAFEQIDVASMQKLKLTNAKPHK